MSIPKPLVLLRFAGSGTTLTNDGTGSNFALAQGTSPTNFTQTAAAGTYDGQYDGKTNSSGSMPYGTTSGTFTGAVEDIGFACRFKVRSVNNSVAALLGRGSDNKGMRVRAVDNGAGGFELNVRVDSGTFGQTREVTFTALAFNTTYDLAATLKTGTPTATELRCKLGAAAVQTSGTQDWDGDTLDTQSITFAKPDDFTDIRGFDGTIDAFTYARGQAWSDTELGNQITSMKLNTTGWPGAGSNQTVSPGGIASQVAYGAVTVIDVNPTAQPGGLGSATALGSHTLAKVAARTLGPVGGVASPAAYGSHTVAITTLKVIQTTGIGSAVALGSHTLANVAARALSPSGIGTAVAFGAHTLVKAAISAGIASMAFVNTFTISTSGVKVLGMQGIGSAVALGAHALANVAAKTIAPAGIASASAYGAHSLIKTTPGTIAPAGIASPSALGSHTLAQPLTKVIAPAGIVSTGSVGGHTVRLASYVPKASPRRQRRLR